jgi:hypothetical protein
MEDEASKFISSYVIDPVDDLAVERLRDFLRENHGSEHGRECQIGDRFFDQDEIDSVLWPVDPARAVNVCSQCAAGICNDDWTHLDYYAQSESDANEEHDRILATLDSMGWLSLVGTGKPIGVWDCPICEEHQYGAPIVFEGQRF